MHDLPFIVLDLSFFVFLLLFYFAFMFLAVLLDVFPIYIVLLILPDFTHAYIYLLRSQKNPYLKP